MSELAFQGSLLLLNVFTGHPQEYMWNQTNVAVHSPVGLVRIPSPHITLFHSTELKSLRVDKNMTNREFKAWMREQIPLLPALPQSIVDFTEIHFAEHGENECLYLKLCNSYDFYMWKDKVAIMIGLSRLPNHSRTLHISIANKTGNPQHSVADVSSPRVFVIWNEELFAYEGDVYASKEAARQAYADFPFSIEGEDYRIEAKVVNQ